MKLTERQKQIYNILEDALGSGDTITQLAMRIDQALPVLPAPEQGHLPSGPPPSRYVSGLSTGVYVMIDLDHFYEDVVMPSRERYMARSGRRATDERPSEGGFNEFVTRSRG
jgi:hypothetical protein